MRSILLAAAFLAAGLVAFPAPAEAHGGRHPGRGLRGAGHGHFKHGHFKTVPRFIATHHRAHFSPYVAGRVYYAPHHHHHVRYLFPVYVNGVIVHQPYFYCGDRLFVSGAVALPRLAIGVNFASPGGFVVGGYDSPGPAYAPYYVGGHRHHEGCDHDDWDD
jgi:hypothetical protein